MLGEAKGWSRDFLPPRSSRTFAEVLQEELEAAAAVFVGERSGGERQDSKGCAC